MEAFDRLGGPDARSAAERYWTHPGRKALPDCARLCLPPEPDTEAPVYLGDRGSGEAWLTAPGHTSFAL